MRYFLFLFLPVLICCNNPRHGQILKQTEEELRILRERVAQLSEELDSKGDLVHIVFFRLKSGTDQDAFITEVQKLAQIEGLMGLNVGPFENLNDDRALSEFALVMEMRFEDKAAYEVYQKHPVHLALRAYGNPFFAGPPATYDYIRK